MNGSWTRQRIMKCNITKCTNRGIIHLYDKTTQKFIGQYCDECFRQLRNHYNTVMVIKRFPREGTSEHQAQILTKKLQEKGIDATQTKDNGVKVILPEKNFGYKKDEIIEILQEV